MKRVLSTLAGGILAFSFYLVASPFVAAGDWTHWRGPEQTGVSREQDLPERFSLNPNVPQSNLIWKQPYGGRSTPLIMNGRVFIIDDAGPKGETPEERVLKQERVVAFDADTGKVLWEYRFNVFQSDIVASRLGWTNLAGDPETGNIYAHGTQGFLLCLDRDGKLVWSHSLTEEYGRISGYGGRMASPIVDGDLVIQGMVNASWGDQARGGNRFVAFDKRTGAVVWWSQPGDQVRGTYYSSPVVAVINGERLVISGASDGPVYALKVRTGEKVWGYTFGARAINTSPVVSGNYVYITHGEESPGTNVQGRIICLDAGKVVKGKPTLVWQVDGIKASYASPIIHDDRLYVPDEAGNLHCFDASNGKLIWKFRYGRVVKGSPVWADDKIYLADVNATFLILKPAASQCVRLHKQFFPSTEGTGANVEINGTPAVANGRVYFMTRDEIYCIGKPNHNAKSIPIPARLGAALPVPGAKATHLQIFPADVVLGPGDSQAFKARTYDANGQFLREVKAEWSLPSPPSPPNSKVVIPPLRGEIDPEGQLTTAKELPGQQGIVVAKADGLVARGRVRVAPPLPYKQDFKKVPLERTPGGWINCQGKFIVVEKDGSKVLKKLADNPNPLLCRAYSYMGLPSLTNYTIQADVMGEQKRADLPDMGIVANRYTLELDGNKQRLRILSWEALPRIDKVRAWEWKADVWYRMRLSVHVNGDKAEIRGKVWPRDEKEPADWSIEFDDPLPNREGSPAIYAYATGILDKEPGAAVYYDNVSVTPNK